MYGSMTNQTCYIFQESDLEYIEATHSFTPGKSMPLPDRSIDKQPYWQTKPLDLINNDENKQLFNTQKEKLRESGINKTTRSLGGYLSDTTNSIKEEKIDSQFKGPLDEFISNIVGDRCGSHFEENKQCDNWENVGDVYKDNNDSVLRYTQCQLELKELKESLSSYSISSIR